MKITSNSKCNMNLTENYSQKMCEILGRKMSEILGWKISQKVPKVRIFPIKISSMENVRNLFVGKCHGKDDISENVRNFRSENVRNFEVETALRASVLIKLRARVCADGRGEPSVGC